jgi:protein-S-isoprenylcysteine O-methyltransferase Ste14
LREARKLSRTYAYLQTLLVCIFAAVALFVRGPALSAPSTLGYVGYALCGAGVVLLAFGMRALHGVVQIAPEPKAGGHLVTTGIYRWLRHPIYTAIVLIVAGLVLRKPGLWLAIVGAAVIAFLFNKTRFEERLLATRYPQYSEYCKRSWGLIPGLR